MGLSGRLEVLHSFGIHHKENTQPSHRVLHLHRRLLPMRQEIDQWGNRNASITFQLVMNYYHDSHNLVTPIAIHKVWALVSCLFPLTFRDNSPSLFPSLCEFSFLVSFAHSYSFTESLKVWVPWGSALSPFAFLFLSLGLTRSQVISPGLKDSKPSHIQTTWQHICGSPLILKPFKWWVPHPTLPPHFQNSKGRAEKPKQ